MQVLDLVENEDGSATLTVDFKQWELQFFVELGMVEAIRKGADETLKEYTKKKPSSEGDEQIQQTLNLQEPKEGPEDWRHEVQ